LDVIFFRSPLLVKIRKKAIEKERLTMVYMSNCPSFQLEYAVALVFLLERERERERERNRDRGQSTASICIDEDDAHRCSLFCTRSDDEHACHGQLYHLLG